MAGLRRSGVTLMELVLVMGVVAVLASLSSVYIREVINLWNFVSFRNEVVAQGRTAMMRMTREMRQVSNQSAVLSANATCFRFVTAGNDTIEYNLSGTYLMRNTNIMAAGVSKLGFVYYNNQSAALSSPKVSPQTTDIRSINATMELTSGKQSKSFTARIFPRNLGD